MAEILRAPVEVGSSSVHAIIYTDVCLHQQYHLPYLSDLLSVSASVVELGLTFTPFN